MHKIVAILALAAFATPAFAGLEVVGPLKRFEIKDVAGPMKLGKCLTEHHILFAMRKEDGMNVVDASGTWDSLAADRQAKVRCVCFGL